MVTWATIPNTKIQRSKFQLSLRMTELQELLSLFWFRMKESHHKKWSSFLVLAEIGNNQISAIWKNKGW